MLSCYVNRGQVYYTCAKHNWMNNNKTGFKLSQTWVATTYILCSISTQTDFFMASISHMLL